MFQLNYRLLLWFFILFISKFNITETFCTVFYYKKNNDRSTWILSIEKQNIHPDKDDECRSIVLSVVIRQYGEYLVDIYNFWIDYFLIYNTLYSFSLFFPHAYGNYWRNQIITGIKKYQLEYICHKSLHTMQRLIDSIYLKKTYKEYLQRTHNCKTNRGLPI